MRILVDIRHLTHPQLSGVGEYTVNILRALFRLDKTNEYVLLSTGRNRVLPLSKGELEGVGGQVKHIHVPVPNKLLNLSLLTTGRPLLDTLAPGPFDLLFLPNLNIVRTTPGLPTVLTVHDLSWKFFPEFFSPKMRAWHNGVDAPRLVAHATHVITPSDATKQDVIRVFNKDAGHITAVPHGVDPMFSAAPDVRDHGVRSRHKLPKRFALFVGTLEPRKNLLAVIDGIAEYRDRTGDPLHLVLAGGWGWNTNDLRKRLDDKQTKGWVHHLGYVPSADRPAIYRAARVFVWPSIYEGFGLPVLEAMASGIPVITSHTSSMPELAGDAAILIDPYNARDLTAALEQLFRSTALEQRMRSRGMERAKSFSWEKAATETLSVFQKTKIG